jgi:hypothetical protein
MAWRVRRHAWRILRQRMQTAAESTQDRETVLAYARLALQQAPGETSTRLFRQLLAQTEDVQTQELMLSWLLSTEQFERARFWLWKTHAKRLTTPAWAEFALASHDNDAAKLRSLLATRADQLASADKIQAAQQLGDFSLAQCYVSEAFMHAPENEIAYQQWAETVVPAASHLTSEHGYFRRGPLASHAHIQEVHLGMTPHFSLTSHVQFFRSWSQDKQVIRNVPELNHYAHLIASYQSRRIHTEMTLHQRETLGSEIGLRLRSAYEWRRKLLTTVMWGWHQPADESSVLSIGGIKNVWQFGATYTFMQSSYLRLELGRRTLYSQDQQFLGRGLSLDWEAGYRIGRPALTFYVSGTAQQYRVGDQVDGQLVHLIPQGGIQTPRLFVPQSFHQEGLHLRFGGLSLERYFRPDRLVLSLGLIHNSVSGFGAAVEGKVATPVFGNDLVSFSAAHVRGGNGVNETSEEFVLSYRHFFSF